MRKQACFLSGIYEFQAVTVHVYTLVMLCDHEAFSKLLIIQHSVPKRCMEGLLFFVSFMVLFQTDQK